MDTAVDDIKARLNIVDVVGEYVRLHKAGSNWKAVCPFHNEKTPSFMVSEDKQIWHCFGCGKGGDIFSFVMEIEGGEFKEVLATLAERAGVELKKSPRVSPEEGMDKNKLYEILELAARFYETQLWKGAGKEKIIPYLHKRGISDESAVKFRLGYAPPGWRHVLRFLLSRGHSSKDISQTGILVEKNPSPSIQNTRRDIQDTNYYDRFRNRIVFPISNIQGKIIGFSARVAPGEDESQAKYVNTPETAVYHKSQVLYGIHLAKLAIKKEERAVLVEGNMDVIALHQEGITNAVAVSGTALTAEQVRTLRRYASQISLFFDTDQAGQAAIVKSTQECLVQGVHAEVMHAGDVKDAADYIASRPGKIGEVLKRAVPALEYIYRTLCEKYNRQDARDKTAIVENMAELLSRTKNKIEVSMWLKKLARDLEIEENIIADIMNKANLPVTRASRGTEKQENKTLDRADRAGCLREQIAVLMFSSPQVWREVENNIDRELFGDDPMLALALKKGQEADYRFSRIAPYLEEVTLKRLNSLIAEKALPDAEKSGSQQPSETDPLAALDALLGALQKEYCRQELHRLQLALAQADQQRDEKRRRALLEKFHELTRRLGE